MLLVSVFLAIILFVLVIRRKITGKKAIALEVLCIYIFLIYIVTVLSRARLAYPHLEIRPFESYIKMRNECISYTRDILYNVLMFMPIGLLMKMLYRRIRIKIVILIGFVLSLSIELLQYVFMCGLSQTDDIIHNVIGIVFGHVVGTVLCLFMNMLGQFVNQLKD